MRRNCELLLESLVEWSLVYIIYSLKAAMSDKETADTSKGS